MTTDTVSQIKELVNNWRDRQKIIVGKPFSIGDEVGALTQFALVELPTTLEGTDGWNKLEDPTVASATLEILKRQLDMN